MRYWGWIAVAVGMAGFTAPATGQPADPASRPDPSGFLLPPVSVSPSNPTTRTTLPPPEPLRRVSADDYPADLPPPASSRSQPSSDRIQPAPSSRTSRPAPEDDYYPPPPKRRAPPPRESDDPRPAPAPRKPRYDDDEYAPAPQPKRKPQPQYSDDVEYAPAPAPRRPAPRYEDEEYAPAPAPARRPAPRYDDDEYAPAPAPKKPVPRYEDEEYAPAPAPKKPAPRYDDEDFPAPRPSNTRSAPAAAISRPSTDRTVSDAEIDGADSSSKSKNESSLDLIQYLTGTDASNSVYQSTGLFGDKSSDVLGAKPHSPLQSDHEFDTFVSPVTNPFLFEDPRSLTEVRPIFIYQRVPNSEPLFNGGNLWFLGLQGRIAFTDRLSLVFNKFGMQGINPASSYGVINDQNGFAELWLGPKYTFLRNTETGAVMAGGLQFQIPIGSSSVYQHTGNLSLVPYFSYAQNFLRSRSGSFNGLISTGYSYSTTSARSDYYYLSGHLDYDVGNKHKFYPLAELNWIYNTTNGSTAPWAFEGRDLINFGSQAKGTGLLTGAIGGRGKLSKSMELGAAFEIPFAGEKDLFQYRWTLDFIWRY